MKHRTLSSVLAAPLLLLLGFTSPGTAAADIETDKLTCAFTFWPGQGVYFLARDLGYFDEEGVEIDLIHEDDIQVQTEAMDAGQLNCNSRTIGEYQSRPRNKETKGIVIAAMDVSLGGDGVVVSGDITDVCQLEGKTFAMEPTLPANLLLQIELKEKCGLTLADLDILHIATADGLAVFEDPSVSAVESYEPLLSQIVANTSREGAYKLVDSADHPTLIVDVWFLHNELIGSEPRAHTLHAASRLPGDRLLLREPGPGPRDHGSELQPHHRGDGGGIRGPALHHLRGGAGALRHSGCAGAPSRRPSTP